MVTLDADEILRDPAAAIGLPPGAVPSHVIVIVEYSNPGSENQPGLPRLGVVVDDNAAPHTTLGMLAFATQLELNAVADSEPDEDD